MAKRRAGAELTHENWDQEDEKEEAGVFSVADTDTLSKRPIIKARRRVTQQEGEQAQTPFAAFKGFTGFGNVPSSSQPGASLSFKSAFTGSGTSPTASQSSKPTVSFSFKPASAAAGTSSSVQPPKTLESESKPSFSFKPSTEPAHSSAMFTSETDSKLSSNGSATISKSGEKTNGADAYATELKALNQSVAAWIKKHVDSNPVCDLSPVFDDYKKHLSEIEQKREVKSQNSAIDAKAKPQLATVSPLSSSQDKTSSSASSFKGFKFGAASQEKEDSAKKDSSEAKPGFSFGSTAGKGFSFGASGSSFSSSSSSASSSSSKGPASFSFGALQSSNAGAGKSTDTNDEETEEPPKAEVKVVEEKDAVFSTRCKVFYKKGGEFRERGVGMLYIKNSGGSVQIVVRADSSLGNVILNIAFSSSMLSHMTKQGKNKNNVMLLSLLNPPADKKCPKCNKNFLNPQESTACEGDCTPDPIPLLLRVKTEADADNIITEIKKLFEED